MRTILTQLPNRNNYLHGRYTIEIGYPWFTYGAIIFVERSVTKNHDVLELGGGGSTIFFSRNCKSVRTYETNLLWEEKIKSALPPKSNVSMICGIQNDLLDALQKEPNNHYDWLIVDSAHTNGRRHRFDFRYAMMKKAIPKLKNGGFMVVDNYGVRPLDTFDYSGWDVYTFDDPDYCGKGTKICIKGEKTWI